MADARNLLDELIDEVAGEDRDVIRNFVRDAFTLSNKKEFNRQITCKDCGKSRMYKIEIDIPDFKERSNAINLLLNQAKGKPKETVKVQVDVGVRPLAEMSLAELEAEEKAILAAHPELAEQN